MLPAFFKVVKLQIEVDVCLVDMIHELKDFGVLDRATAISMTSQCQTSPRRICMVVKFDEYFCCFVARGF
jgi:hypothetical protein